MDDKESRELRYKEMAEIITKELKDDKRGSRLAFVHPIFWILLVLILTVAAVWWAGGAVDYDKPVTREEILSRSTPTELANALADAVEKQTKGYLWATMHISYRSYEYDTIQPIATVYTDEQVTTWVRGALVAGVITKSPWTSREAKEASWINFQIERIPATDTTLLRINVRELVSPPWSQDFDLVE